jgi:hypothetical protein
MTISKDEIVSAIAKLNDLTRRKEITWFSVDPETKKQVRSQRTIKSSYITNYEGRTLRLSECVVFQKGWLSDESIETINYMLELLDEYGEPIYEFPEVQGMSDLLASVKGQLANVEGLIRSLLTSL